MKKQTVKNFIAFTLSEMMIVLLIISVISAATLPAITSRDEVKAGQSVQAGAGAVNIKSAWMPDATHTKGYYYKKNANTELIIGQSLSESILSQTARVLQYGRASARLYRFYPEGCNNITCGYSAIAFYSKGNKYSGRIASNLHSIAIGKNAGWGGSSSYGNSENNLIVGTYAGYKSVLGNYNTMIGAYAGQNSQYTNYGNVMIGNSITNNNMLQNNVLMGYSATAFGTTSYSSSNYVGIGAYAGYAGSGNRNGVDIGYYAGAKPVNKNLYSYSAVNIGAYAGYGSYSNGTQHKIENNSVVTTIQDLYGTVNLGYYAGAEAYFNNNQTNAIGVVNIGDHAGYGSPRTGSVNIGSYAGSNNRAGAEISEFNVNIGRYAGSNVSNYDGGTMGSGTTHNVNIGNYAGYKMSGFYMNNIGAYAGYSTTGERNVNIGHYAGKNTKMYDSVSIGYFAGANTNASNVMSNSVFITPAISSSPSTTINTENSVSIGCVPKNYSTINWKSDYRFCMGGKMPFSAGSGLSGNSKIVWETHGDSSTTPKYRYQMLFIPGGELATNNFTNTSIYLYAKYVASVRNNMYTFSDKRLKENIKQTKYGIDKLRKIMIYQFNMIGSSTPAIGVIAQELMKHYPYAVEVIPESIKKGGYYSINADWIIFSLAQSIKDVDGYAQNLSKTLVSNVDKLVTLTSKVDSVENRLDKVSQSQRDMNKLLDEISKTERK